jgi:mRNA-degrading endonuclease YafQ of YafQ-DinJ toxin-antitoxin module
VSYTLVFTEQYNRRALRFIKRHPELKSQYLKALQLLELNPSHPSLRLHALKGKLKPLQSVSINMSYRITLELLVTEKEIILVNIGSHEEVY